MNLKKIVAAFAAAAMAVTMTAVSAFAFEMDTEYTGGWSASKTIPKAEFAAVGGDVKVVLTVERKPPLVGDGNFLLKPMNICSSWDAITSSLTSDTAIAKGDGFIVVPKDVTTIEFVVPEDVWSGFVPYADEEGDGSAGLAFQVNDVIIKNAELSAGTPQGEFQIVDEAQSADLMRDGIPAEEAAVEETEAPAEEVVEETEAAVEEVVVETEAPVADAPVATTPAATGNAAASAIAVVMVAAGAVAVASKRK